MVFAPAPVVDVDAVTPVRPAAQRQLPTARCAQPVTGETQSRGLATRGRLTHGCLLPRRGRGYVRKNRAGWGTQETVALMQWAAGQVIGLYPESVSVIVGAISSAEGGPLRGHRSHQSGRDVDIGYFATNNQPLTHFRAMSQRNIDIEKTWALLGALLSTSRVQYMFMDYNLQALFYRHLEREGVGIQTLTRLFQFPRGRAARRGIIRHAKGHADHVHVRFRCPIGDRCQ